MQDHRAFLVSLFDAAVEAANPDQCLRAFLPEVPLGRTIVVGAGKGSAQLARALEKLWPGTLEGAIVTRYGYGTACDHIEVLEASHPVPDEAGLLASERMLELVSDLTAEDLVIALVCGGGSALLPAPPEGFDLADEIALNEALLKSGAPISAMNSIRKQFSRIKGGRLAAAAHPAKVVSLVVSDIPGDDASLVSSGPTIPSVSTPQDGLAMIDRYGIELPPHIVDHLRSTKPAPLPDDPVFEGNEVHVVASAKVSLEAASAASEKAGIPAVILSDSLEGEAREAGAFHAALAREIESNARPFQRPVVLLSGGETTVTVKGKGKGGRNTEFLLSLALSISSTEGVHALAADTDGIDGSEDNAGAFVDGSSIDRMLDRGVRAEDHLINNDAWTAFEAVGDLFVCGPTGTNVNDFRAILVL
ncbi:hydroxypyruvate reductase [Rhizobium sp. Root1203]|uniref:glycerate kinase type-2 family protein n=1 Tax=Rhizobium sp. Root1203 TaxID=1736427 RepID=UPI00070989F6|nr:glycerate kinase [Rhizobium sp. Root1203]KQV27092.1 hydroxypyruvate reductase [Rhizobium sp. Root1203]